MTLPALLVLPMAGSYEILAPLEKRKVTDFLFPFVLSVVSAAVRFAVLPPINMAPLVAMLHIAAQRGHQG